MNEIRSLRVQAALGDALEAAQDAPLVLVNRGQPRAVLLSADEFRRLKRAAGEGVPAAAQAREPLLFQGREADPLGYETGDLLACARTMAEAALSGRNRDAVAAERARVRHRLGLPPLPA